MLPGLHPHNPGSLNAPCQLLVKEVRAKAQVCQFRQAHVTRGDPTDVQAYALLPPLLSYRAMGEWDDACVVCGGPPTSKHSAPEHNIEWLDCCLDITEASTEPVQIGPYDGAGSYGDPGDFVSHTVGSHFHPEEFGEPLDFDDAPSLVQTDWHCLPQGLLGATVQGARLQDEAQ